MSRHKTPSTVQPLYYTIADVCRLLGLSRTKVNLLIRCEHLPTEKFGTAVRIPITDFETWRESRRANSCAVQRFPPVRQHRVEQLAR